MGVRGEGCCFDLLLVALFVDCCSLSALCSLPCLLVHSQLPTPLPPLHTSPNPTQPHNTPQHTPPHTIQDPPPPSEPTTPTMSTAPTESSHWTLSGTSPTSCSRPSAVYASPSTEPLKQSSAPSSAWMRPNTPSWEEEGLMRISTTWGTPPAAKWTIQSGSKIASS